MLTVSSSHWVCPTHGLCAFIVYSSQALGCSAGELSEVSPGLRALPRFKSLRFRFWGTPQRCRLRLACILCPSQVRAAQATRCLASSVSPRWGGCILFLPPSQPLSFLGAQKAHLLGCTMFLFLGADIWLRPSRQMSTILNPMKSWLAMEPAYSLIEDASLGPRFPLSSSG